MYAFLATPLALLGLLGGLDIVSASRHHHLAHHHELRRSTGPIEITGEHEFQPPTAGQQRGPCPGLNALANHGYISRDGIASLLEVTTAIIEVYNMNIELATILAVMGVVWTGNVVSLDPSFSIGGADRRVQGGLLGLMGTPQGLDLSHNFIESDSSATRDDIFVTGDASTMNLTRFEGLFNMVPVDTKQGFTIDTVGDFAAKRFDQTIGENPRFYYGPYTGFIARNAGFVFMARCMANHPDGDVDGILTHDILKSFFGVTGEPGKFIYRRGWERIPDNWYHRPVPYSLVDLNVDLVRWTVSHPKLASIGGNMGTVNSFTGVDLSDPVSGLTNAPKLLEGNNLMCFALEFVKQSAPSYTNNIFATIAEPLNILFDALSVPLLSLACPQYELLTRGGQPLWEALQKKFPGAKKASL